MEMINLLKQPTCTLNYQVKRKVMAEHSPALNCTLFYRRTKHELVYTFFVEELTCTSLYFHYRGTKHGIVLRMFSLTKS